MFTAIKTIIKATFIWILSISVSSCHNEYFPGPAAPDGIRMEGIAYFDKCDLDLLKGTEDGYILNCMHATGTSNAVYLWELTLENTHLSIYVKSKDRIYLKNGKFRITGVGITAIYGTYEGTGTCKGNIFNSDLDFEIIGGEGYYQDSSGLLQGTIKTTPENPTSLLMNFNGIINPVVKVN